MTHSEAVTVRNGEVLTGITEERWTDDGVVTIKREWKRGDPDESAPHPFDNDTDATDPCRCGAPLAAHGSASVEWVGRQQWNGPVEGRSE